MENNGNENQLGSGHPANMRSQQINTYIHIAYRCTFDRLELFYMSVGFDWVHKDVLQILCGGAAQMGSVDVVCNCSCRTCVAWLRECWRWTLALTLFQTTRSSHVSRNSS